MVAHRSVGSALLFLGELSSAREHLDRSIALYNPQQHRSLVSIYGVDSLVVSHTWASWALWSLGYPDQALDRSTEALAQANEVSHPFSQAFALCLAAYFHQFRRESSITQELTEATIALCTEREFVFWMAAATATRGWSLAEQGQTEDGTTQMRQGMAILRTIGTELSLAYNLALLSEMYGRAGEVQEGLTVMAEALALIDKKELGFYEPELYRLKGQLLLMQSEAEGEGEECFHQAIDVARRQSMKSWELRAVMSLSHLWQKQGKVEDARQLLAEVYDWFTEGFDTADLKEAKALLEELAR